MHAVPRCTLVRPMPWVGARQLEAVEAGPGWEAAVGRVLAGCEMTGVRLGCQHTKVKNVVVAELMQVPEWGARHSQGRLSARRTPYSSIDREGSNGKWNAGRFLGLLCMLHDIRLVLQLWGPGVLLRCELLLVTYTNVSSPSVGSESLGEHNGVSKLSLLVTVSSRVLYCFPLYLDGGALR